LGYVLTDSDPTTIPITELFTARKAVVLKNSVLAQFKCLGEIEKRIYQGRDFQNKFWTPLHGSWSPKFILEVVYSFSQKSPEY